MGDSDEDCKLEIFVGCRALYGEAERDGINSFAVLWVKQADSVDFQELARTETICNSAAPQYCTSFELSYRDELASTTMLRVDIYGRKTEDTERLSDHEHFAKATMSLRDVLSSTGHHRVTQLSHPSREEKMGILTVSAEKIDVTNGENNSDVHLDVAATILRKRDWNKTILCQRYEIQRSHAHDDCDGHTVWLPIYRSDRISKQRKSSTSIEFSGAFIKYRHLCNGDEERRIRLLVYIKPEAGKKTYSEALLGTCEFSIRDICELDPTEEVLQLERASNVEIEEIGSVAILKAEPTDFGSHFSLRINHEGTDKYSSGSEERKPSISRKKFMLALSTRDKQVNSKKSLVSDLDALFSNSFTSDKIE